MSEESASSSHLQGHGRFPARSSRKLASRFTSCALTKTPTQQVVLLHPQEYDRAPGSIQMIGCIVPVTTTLQLRARQSLFGHNSENRHRVPLQGQAWATVRLRAGRGCSTGSRLFRGSVSTACGCRPGPRPQMCQGLSSTSDGPRRLATASRTNIREHVLCARPSSSKVSNPRHFVATDMLQVRHLSPTSWYKEPGTHRPRPLGLTLNSLMSLVF